MLPLGLVDLSFFTANLAKLFSGGYVPLLLASAVYAVMAIWHVGTDAVGQRIRETVRPLDEFLASLKKDHIPRVPGTAVFLTRSQSETPPVLQWYVQHARALHEKVFILRVISLPSPWSQYVDRLKIERLTDGFSRGVATYGFMERPDVPALLREAKLEGCPLDLDDATYFIGHETIVARCDQRPRARRNLEPASLCLLSRRAGYVETHAADHRDQAWNARDGPQLEYSAQIACADGIAKTFCDSKELQFRRIAAAPGFGEFRREEKATRDIDSAAGLFGNCLRL
jgi:hypothetical protein